MFAPSSGSRSAPCLVGALAIDVRLTAVAVEAVGPGPVSPLLPNTIAASGGAVVIDKDDVAVVDGAMDSDLLLLLRSLASLWLDPWPEPLPSSASLSAARP